MKIIEKKSLRKDVGDLTSLTESIKKIGLINKISITKDGVIVSGRRRFHAWKLAHKKWPKIISSPMPPFVILPYTYAEMQKNPSFNLYNTMQIHENTQRKDFTASEISEIKRTIEKERSAGNNDYAGKDTRDIVGELTGMGGSKVDHIDAIVKSAKKNTQAKKALMKLNAGQISVDTAYQMVVRSDRSLPKIDPPKGEYDMIYMDMPIGFDDTGGRGAAEKHYPTETPEYFLKTEIPAAKDCVLFAWFPNAFVIDGTAGRVFDNWGFYPKTMFTWVKDRVGVGGWSMNQTEQLIMGIKGDVSLPAKRFPTVIMAKRESHSKKPDKIVIPMIEQMFPKRKRIILWHRGQAPKGWKVHGNEVEK